MAATTINLQTFLGQKTELSNKHIKAAVRDGRVQVNGCVVAHRTEDLYVGDIVAVTTEEEELTFEVMEVPVSSGVIFPVSQPLEKGRPYTIDVENISAQPFEYLCVLDFEATCCNRNSFPRHEMEIIEFPTVLVNAATGLVEAEFRLYVKPERHPRLTAFCTELTGITQSDVAGCRPFADALEEYTQWLTGLDIIGDHPARCAFVTCGDWDFKTCLPNQCRLSGIPIPDHMQSWVNIKHVFEEVMKTRAPGMDGMLANLRLELVGRHHSGLDDCRNIAKIALYLLERGAVFSPTKPAGGNNQRGRRGGRRQGRQGGR